MNDKRVEWIWRQEGLKVPAKQPKRRRLWLGDGLCIRLRPTHRNHVWSYDLVMDRTRDGRAFRMLTIVDEYMRECLAIDASRKLTSEDVLARLSDLFVRRGVPDHIRSDNGSEFPATRVRDWLGRVRVKTLYIEPRSPWENGYIEGFNGSLREELLDRDVFDTLLEAKVLIERWRRAYNTIRPYAGVPAPGPGVAPPLSACFGYASASGQGRSLGRAALVIETGCISGGRSAGVAAELRVAGTLTPGTESAGCSRNSSRTFRAVTHPGRRSDQTRSEGWRPPPAMSDLNSASGTGPSRSLFFAEYQGRGIWAVLGEKQVNQTPRTPLVPEAKGMGKGACCQSRATGKPPQTTQPQGQRWSICSKVAQEQA